MNMESWDPLYIFFAIVTIPLCMMAMGLKFYEVYTHQAQQATNLGNSIEP
jgi:hypothetical protein